MAASAALNPACLPLLHIDAEGGLEVVRHIAGVTFVEVFNWANFEKLSKGLIAQKGMGFKTIIVDNLSEIYNMAITSAAGGPQEQPEIQEYGKGIRDIIHYIRQYRDVLARKEGINVIMCCWDADEKDDRGILKKDLALSPKLREQVPGLVTIIGHVQVTNDPTNRKLTFAPGPRTVAKLRRPVTKTKQLPFEVTYDLDHLPMGDIIGVLKGDQDWPTDKYKALNPPVRNT